MRLVCTAFEPGALFPQKYHRLSNGSLKRGILSRRSAKIAHSRPVGKSIVRKNNNAKRYYVSGMVQGVGYRYFAERTAEQLGIMGYVRNLRDGRVEVYAIGPADSLASLRQRLENGPIGASVEKVTEEDSPIDSQFEHGFSIEYDG